MNDQQELDAKEIELIHLRNMVEGLQLHVKVMKSDRDRWMNHCRTKWQAIAASYAVPSLLIGIAIGWFFL